MVSSPVLGAAALGPLFVAAALPVDVTLQGHHVGQRLCLGREAGVGLAVALAGSLALSGLAGLEEQAPPPAPREPFTYARAGNSHFRLPILPLANTEIAGA